MAEPHENLTGRTLSAVKAVIVGSPLSVRLAVISARLRHRFRLAVVFFELLAARRPAR